MTLDLDGDDRGALPALPSDHMENHTDFWGGWEGIISMLGEDSF